MFSRKKVISDVMTFNVWFISFFVSHYIKEEEAKFTGTNVGGLHVWVDNLTSAQHLT